MIKLLTPLLTLLPAMAAAAAPLVIGHRGASYYAPENTIPSEKLALEQNADGYELDVHLSKDQKLIVIHDPTTSRTTNGALTVADADSAELRKLDAGSWKDPKYAGTKLPFLSESLDLLPAGKLLYLEIKGTRESVPFVKEAIEKSGKRKGIVIIGFDLDSVSDAKKALPDLPVYWLRGNVKDKKTKAVKPYPLGLIKTAKEHNLDGLDLQSDGIDKRLSDAAAKAGIQLHAWTVDDPAEAHRIADLGVKSITTNRPDVILAAFKGEAKGTEAK